MVALKNFLLVIIKIINSVEKSYFSNKFLSSKILIEIWRLPWMEISKVKITVLKRTVMKDLVDAYKAGAEETAEHECEVFKEGQEFIVENLGMPEGFCSWAWADIQRDVTVLALGGDFPWIKQKGVGISCCTDGLRPVIFKLERIE